MEGMDIYSLKGTKVTYAFPENGNSQDQGHVSKHLEVGKIYTVERTNVGQWLTKVFLIEVPDTFFNSVFFGKT